MNFEKTPKKVDRFYRAGWTLNRQSRSFDYYLGMLSRFFNKLVFTHFCFFDSRLLNEALFRQVFERLRYFPPMSTLKCHAGRIAAAEQFGNKAVRKKTAFC